MPDPLSTAGQPLTTPFDTARRAHLMLRRGLVLSRAEAIIEETIAFCVENGIDEVVWKCDAESFNHGITPLPVVRQYVPILSDARRRTLEAGLIHSVNPWITLKWSDFGRDQRAVHTDFDWRVDAAGATLHGCACLRSEGWRDWLCEAYRLYASTRPAVLWLEDDYKTFMSGGGCFCESCLAAFSDRIGEDLDREILMQRVLAPGTPHTMRAQWIDFLGAEMVETCRRLERAVHAESPDTRLGIMGSWSSDGRWWHAATVALAGPLEPIARPSLAPYVEGRALDFMPDRFDIVKEMICFGPGTQNCPELENSTYTPFSKSMRMTRLQMALSQFLGNHAITMNLFDMVGTPLEQDPRVGSMLLRLKPQLNDLAAACGPGGTQRGVNIVWNPRLADHVRLRDGEGIEAFNTDGEGWAAPLQGSGLPVVWNAPGATVSAATGRTLQALDKDAVLKLLGGGLLLDGSAAKTLIELGHGEHLGVQLRGPRQRYDQALSAERLSDERFAGGQGEPGVYIDFRRYNERNTFYELEPVAAAQTISHYVDPDENPVFAATTLFENTLGGRVAVHAFDLSQPPSPSFMTWTRKRQLTSIVRWLNHGSLDLFVEGGAWMVPFRHDHARYVLVGLLNFETDEWNGFKLTMAWEGPMPARVLIAHDRAGWRDVEPNDMKLVGEHLSAAFEVGVKGLDFLALALLTQP